MNFEHDTEETLKKKIIFWQNKLNASKNPSEKAVLADKISFARNELREMQLEKTHQEVKTLIDAPSMADKVTMSENGIELSRGQIMDCGSVFKMEL